MKNYIIPPSPRNEKFIIVDKFHGIGLIELAIMFFSLIILTLVSAMIVISGLSIEFMIVSISVLTFFTFLINFVLLYYDENLEMKYYQLIIDYFVFVFSKRKYSYEEHINKFDIYSYDDQNNLIQTKEVKLKAFEIKGINLLFKDDEQIDYIIERIGTIFRNTDLNIDIFKYTDEFDDYRNIEYLVKLKEETSNELLNDFLVNAKERLNSIEEKYVLVVSGNRENVLREANELENQLKEIGLFKRELNYDQFNNFVKNYTLPFKNRFDSFVVKAKDIEFNYKDEEENQKKFYVSYFTLTNYPYVINAAWLRNIASIEGVKISFKMSNISLSESIRNLDLAIQRNILKLESSKADYKKSLNEEVEILNKRYSELLAMIKSDEETLKDVMMIISVFGNDKEDLRNRINKLKVLSKKDNLKIKNIVFNQWESWESTLPKRKAILKDNISREMPSISIASSYPFFYDNFIDEKGLLISNSEIGDVFLDLKTRDNKRMNSNSFIVGTTGSGKSTVAKKLLNWDLLNGNKVFVIDPENEYKDLAKIHGGQVVDLSGMGEYVINPLQIFKEKIGEVSEINIEENYIANHIQFLVAFLESIHKKIDENDKFILQKELTSFYEKLKITNLKITKNYEIIKWPIFNDFYKYLKTRSKSIVGELKSNYERLELMFYQFTSNGVYYNIWGKESKINFEGNLIVFDISKLNENITLRTGQFFLITKLIWSEIQGNKEINESTKNKKWISLLLDEAHVVINSRNELALNWLFGVTKRIRKYNGQLYLVTQNISDFLGDESIKHLTSGIINNCIYSFIGKMNPNDLKALDELYGIYGGLSNNEKEYLKNSQVGQFIIFVGAEKIYIPKVFLNKLEMKL